MSAIGTIYDRLLRDRLPRKYGVMAGVCVRNCRILDLVDNNPDFKYGLVNLINETVEPGDIVVDIGAGWGVCTIHAARIADRVIAIEASKEMTQVIKQTVEDNWHSGQVAVWHGSIGPVLESFGELGTPAELTPGQIPPADVAILDCEGAELDILPLGLRAQKVLVECHPDKGATADKVRDAIEDAGYEITDERWMKPSEQNKLVFRGEK